VIVNVRMADGRTTFQFASRKDLQKALGMEPDDSHTAGGWVKWNPDDPNWVPLRVCHIRKHSVAFVVAAEDVVESDDDLPAKEVAEARLAAWQKREAEEEAA
jgi:hypothetical protein